MVWKRIPRIRDLTKIRCGISEILKGYGIRQRSSPLHEKFDFHQIYSVQIWCKKVRSKVKSRPEMVNTAFANEFTTPCKGVCQCLICHLCLRFPPRLHFFCTIFTLSKFVQIQFFVQLEGRGFHPNLSKGCAIGKITFGIAVTEVRDSREKGAGIALGIGTLLSRSNLSGQKSQQKSITSLILDP